MPPFGMLLHVGLNKSRLDAARASSGPCQNTCLGLHSNSGKTDFTSLIGYRQLLQNFIG